MTTTSNADRPTHAAPSPAARGRLRTPAARRCLAAAAACLVLAGCGGSDGGEEETDFEARRIIALGDEASLIVDRNNDRNGSKYSVNQTVSETDASLACHSNPLWIQVLANQFDLHFPECNYGASQDANPQSRIRAAYGARATDLSEQIGAQLAESDFRDDDLVTILVGVHDVVAEYQKYPFVGEDELVRNVEDAARETARQVNRLADLDTRIIVSTIPDIRYSPYARAESASHTDTDRAALIGRLVTRYNTTLRATIRNDGRHIGLVLADELVQTIVAFPGTSGVVDTATAVCDPTRSALVPPSSLDCTDRTLIAGASASAYMWADELRLGPNVHGDIGELASNRARNNPF